MGLVRTWSSQIEIQKGRLQAVLQVNPVVFVYIRVVRPYKCEYFVSEFCSHSVGSDASHFYLSLTI